MPLTRTRISPSPSFYQNLLSTSPSLSFSSINRCGELHTISASVCCCPGNRDTKNRSSLLLTSLVHNLTVSTETVRLVTLSIDPDACSPHPGVHLLPGAALADSPLDAEAAADGGRRLSHLCSTAISFSMLFSLPSSAFLGIHLMATSLWVPFSSAKTTSENAPLEHTHRLEKGREMRGGVS